MEIHVKLYNSMLSPYSARVRIALYAKNLPCELATAPGGTGSPEYKRLNPTGKVPALEDAGAVIVESEVICEYLEERFPATPLMPADPVARARVRTLARFGDLYLAPPMTGLFGQLSPKSRDAKLVGEKLAELAAKLDQLEQLLAAEPFAAGKELSLADCALAPQFFFMTRIMPIVGGPSPLEGRPKTARVGEAVARHPAVARVLGEMGAAFAERMGAAAR
jgi:glutathione S-transferase